MAFGNGSVPNVIKIYDVFACLITMSWLSHRPPAAACRLHDRVSRSPEASGELRDNHDVVIRRANMS